MQMYNRLDAKLQFSEQHGLWTDGFFKKAAEAAQTSDEVAAAESRLRQHEDLYYAAMNWCNKVLQEAIYVSRVRAYPDCLLCSFLESTLPVYIWKQ